MESCNVSFNLRNWMRKVVYVLVIVMAFFAGMAFTPRNSAIAQLTADPLLSEIERTFTDLYNRVSPSVVAITVDQQTTSGAFIQINAGSGFVIDHDGYIVTNYHVVEGGDRIAISFFDGTITRGEVVGSDSDSDLAVIRVDLPMERLSPVTFADSESLVIGQTALAIGSPFGQRWTLTSGIISALEREIEGFGGYRIGSAIQTDAAINPGSSGGPLLNLRGEVVGVNTQILSERRANSGVGFAVPSKLVRRVTGELIETGIVRYSFLGISGRDVSLTDIENMELPNNLRGVVITNVSDGEPAARAGLRVNSDIITAINDYPILSMSSLIGYLASNTLPGETVTMSVFRDGESFDIDIVLGSRR
jgi:S1-C subfamily serine protease